MERIGKFLAALPIFKDIPADRLNAMVADSLVRTFATGEVIIRYGQPGSFLGIVLEGKAAVKPPADEEDREVISTLEPGDLMGEMSLLTGEPTIADVVALDGCQVFMIPQEAFAAYLAGHPAALQYMARTVTERMKSRQHDLVDRARVEKAWHDASDPYGLALQPAVPARVLIFSSTRSRIRFTYYDTAAPRAGVSGDITAPGTPDARMQVNLPDSSVTRDPGSVSRRELLRQILEVVPVGAAALTAVGHRVAHGNMLRESAMVVDDAVIAEIKAASHLAAGTNPFSLEMIEACRELLPEVPQAAVFDTGFHQTMPLHAALYGLPYELYETYGIRRFGSHGIDHQYAALRAAEFLQRPFRDAELITCRLGDSTSLCAIDHGRSVDNSMGFTPLGGLPDSTTSGDIDPAIISFLVKGRNMELDNVMALLHREGGLKGIAGKTGDFRELEKLAGAGDPRAMLAVNVFGYQTRTRIGAYYAAMGGLDALVFTGGIGCGSAWVRGVACQGLTHLGLQLDDLKNQNVPADLKMPVDISRETSRVRILVVPADPDRMLVRETIHAVRYRAVANVARQKDRTIPVEVSAHHVHISRAELDALFGPGYELTKLADLSQPGQFACKETLTLVGPKGRVERLRILGPVRPEFQAEISITEEFKLGVKAPIRLSGDVEGTPGVTLEGPAGTCTVDKGVINALRHIHMTPADALRFGLKDHDIVMVEVGGERKLIFGDVLVRVHPEFKLAMHLDTDEANAGNILTGMEGRIVSVQDRR